MSITLYQTFVPLFKKMLNNLSAIMIKAEQYAQNKNIHENVLIQSRLYPDMFPLVKQIQIATDLAKGGCARLAGVTIPVFEDNEVTFAEIQARISKTIDFLNTVTPEQIDGSEENAIQFSIRDREFHFNGQDYFTYWVLPNFFFHVTTAYDILRHNGLEIGKRDYLGAFK